MLVFIGPLPPPLHGFSTINLGMLRRLQKVAKTHIFDTTPVSSKLTLCGKIKNFYHRCSLLANFFWICISRRPTAVYMGLSGGSGQILDIVHILIARLAGIRVFIHHHSFAYLNRVRWHNRLCMRVARHCRHILLCDRMAAKLTAIYHIDPQRTVVLSNGAFLDESESFEWNRQRPDYGMTLGFISNITAAKGIEEFFEVVHFLQQMNLPIKAIIAGPVAPEIEQRFSAMLAKCLDTEYLGPIYGDDKATFFRRIDLLLFPTKYENEAEPVTIIEALRSGVAVLAADRGCIASMVDERCGKVFPAVEQFVGEATGYIVRLLNDVKTRAQLSENAVDEFKKRRLLHASRLKELVAEIALGANKHGG